MTRRKTQTRNQPPPTATTTNSPNSHSDDAPEDARARRYLRFVEQTTAVAAKLPRAARAAFWNAEAERLDKAAAGAGGAAANFLRGVPDQKAWAGDKEPTQNIVVSPEHAALNFTFAMTCATKAAVCRKIAEMGGHFQEASVVVVLGRALPPGDVETPDAAPPVEPPDVPEKNNVEKADADAPHVFSATTQYDGNCSVCQRERGAAAHKAAARAERERIKAGGPKRDAAFWRSKVGAFAARPPSQVKFDDDGGVYDLQFREGGKTNKLTEARVRDWSARLRSVVSDYVWKETMLALADVVERGELPARLNGLSNDLQVRRLIAPASWYGGGMGETIKSRDEFDEAVALVAPLVPEPHDIRPGFCHACQRPVAVFDGVLVVHREPGGEGAKECAASACPPRLEVSASGQVRAAGARQRDEEYAVKLEAHNQLLRDERERIMSVESLEMLAEVRAGGRALERIGVSPDDYDDWNAQLWRVQMDAVIDRERQLKERAARESSNVVEFPTPPDVPAAVAAALAAEPSPLEIFRDALAAEHFETTATFREWRDHRRDNVQLTKMTPEDYAVVFAEMRARAVRIAYKDTLAEPTHESTIARLITDSIVNVDLWTDAELTTQREIFRRVWDNAALAEPVRKAGQKCYTAACGEQALRDAGKRRRA